MPIMAPGARAFKKKKKSALFTYNSCALTLNLFKCTLQQFLINLQSVQLSPQSSFRVFPLPPSPKSLLPICGQPPPPAPPRHFPPATTDLLSVFLDLPFLNFLHKCNPPRHSLLHLPSFTERHVFGIHPCCGIYRECVPVYP